MFKGLTVSEDTRMGLRGLQKDLVIRPSIYHLLQPENGGFVGPWETFQTAYSEYQNRLVKGGK